MSLTDPLAAVPLMSPGLVVHIGKPGLGVMVEVTVSLELRIHIQWNMQLAAVVVAE